jgi:hypothetical protein
MSNTRSPPVTKNQPQNFLFHSLYHSDGIDLTVCPPLPLILLQPSPKRLEVMHALIQSQDQSEPVNAPFGDGIRLADAAQMMDGGKKCILM